MIVIIDNYDSFTYNLVQAIGTIDPRVRMKVILNNEATVAEIAGLRPTRLIISPGPGNPDEAGVSLKAVTEFAGKVPILGVCLGHQCIGQAFGGRIERAKRIMHGKTSEVNHDGIGIFAGLPNPFTAARYHSLVVAESTVPAGFVRSAWTSQNEIMAIRHIEWPIDGVQFHPESFLSTDGPQLIRNFLSPPATGTPPAHP